VSRETTRDEEIRIMVEAQHNPVTVACVPSAVPQEMKARWLEVGKRVYAAAAEIRELPNGYAFRLPSDAKTLVEVAEYVSLDRLCCAFVHWSLQVEPAAGPLWLHITGPEGTKELTRNALETTDLLREDVARAAGFRLDCRVPV
jgi:hypothetical protein